MTMTNCQGKPQRQVSTAGSLQCQITVTQPPCDVQSLNQNHSKQKIRAFVPLVSSYLQRRAIFFLHTKAILHYRDHYIHVYNERQTLEWMLFFERQSQFSVQQVEY